MAHLSPTMQRFILHWGEMGTRWGVNRTVAQIHALLYLSPAPLTAEEIAESLDVARSNVSTSLKELQSWGIVRALHVLGDRRDHFESMTDVWEMFQIILEQRKRREMDPTLEVLRGCVADVDPADEPHLRKRLGEMLDFFETTGQCYEEFRRMPAGAIRSFMRVRGKLRKLLGSFEAIRMTEDTLIPLVQAAGGIQIGTSFRVPPEAPPGVPVPTASSGAQPGGDARKWEGDVLWTVTSAGSAVGGACLWILAALAALIDWLPLGTIEIFFLFAPLVVVPLGLGLARAILAREGFAAPVALRAAIIVQPVAAIAALFSFLLERGMPAAALASAWLLAAALAAFAAIETLHRARADRQRPTVPVLCALAGLAYFPVGGAWLVLSRGGIATLGFLEPIPLLTALHYHFAGLAAPTLVGAAGLFLGPRAPLLRTLHRTVAIPAIAGPALLGAGWALGLPLLKLIAAILLSGAHLGLAVLVGLTIPRLRSLPARGLLAISAAATAAGMFLSAAYAIGEFRETFVLGIPVMARTHGATNAFGFVLCGLLGWLLAFHGGTSIRRFP